MIDDIARTLRLIRHTQIISDPFEIDTPGNLYEAYMMGYNNAYKEIEEGLIKIKKRDSLINDRMDNIYSEMVNELTDGLKSILNKEELSDD